WSGLAFFSSRRRHTRFSRDWSSDVCSSDLTLNDGLASTDHLSAMPRLLINGSPDMEAFARSVLALESRGIQRVAQVDLDYVYDRSEERRVGNEARAGSPRADGEEGNVECRE